MRRPFVFDARNLWEPERLRRVGFEYHSNRPQAGDSRIEDADHGRRGGSSVLTSSSCSIWLPLAADTVEQLYQQRPQQVSQRDHGRPARAYGLVKGRGQSVQDVVTIARIARSLVRGHP